MTIASLNAKTYALYLEELHQEDPNASKKYLYVQNDGKYQVLDRSAGDLDWRNKKVSFREIVLTGIKFKSSLLKNKNIEVIPSIKRLKQKLSLERMCKEKLFKEQRRHLFFQILFLVCDCCRNYFAGYGLKSTAALALDLINEWEIPLDKLPSANYQSPKKQRPSSVSSPSLNNLPIDEKPVTPVKGLQALWEGKKKPVTFTPPRDPTIPNPELIKHLTLKQAKEIYKKDPINSDPSVKKKIFTEIVLLEDIFNLMMELNETQIIGTDVEKERGIWSQKVFNLDTKICHQVALDIFKLSVLKLADALAREFDKYPLFDLSFLESCFKVCVERAQEENGGYLSLGALEILMKMYYTHYLNNATNQINSPILPVNNPFVVATFCILLEKKHNCDDHIQKYLSRYIKYPEFDIKTFIAFMTIFKEKEKNYPHLDFSTQKILIEHFKNNPSLQLALEKETDCQAMKDFLKNKCLIG